MKSKFAILIAATVPLSALGAASASASAIYTYTGNPFTTVISPYTTTDSLTGSLTLSTALGDNLDGQAVFPSSFTFSDGVQTITNSDACCGTQFVFSTNSSGKITGWVVEPSTAISDGFILSILTSADTAQDFGAINTILGGPSSGFNTDTQGTWTVSQTPLPAALPLFATGLAVTGLLGWRKKRKAAAALAAV